MFAQSLDFYGSEVFANSYVFPPLCLIPRIFKYLDSLKLPYTLVVPDVLPDVLFCCLCYCLHALPVACWLLKGQVAFFSPLPRMDSWTTSQSFGTFGFSVFPID